MNVLRFVTGHRGVRNSVRRTAQILNRFGHSPERMGARFERFMDVLDEFAIRPTFPITALPLSRNPRFARRLLERGAELAVHAWSHIDLTTLDYAGQKAHMGQAIQLFRDCGVPFTGFRAPYLHWDDNTMRVVEDFHFRYSSNQTIWWDVISTESLSEAQRDGIRRGRAFYAPASADAMRALPFRRRGFVEIPVSLPDDEIPLDRMYVHDLEFLEKMWCGILDETWRRGELFTLQLHPERIDFFTPALRALLSRAREKGPGVWIATLDEIARWWTEKAGNRADFTREDDGHRVDVRACAGTTLHVRENAVTRSLEPGPVFVRGPVRPCVGVEPGSERGAVQALEELGYVVEVGERADDYAVHVGLLTAAGGIRDALPRIDACRGPLVYFGTWPRGLRSAMAVTGDIDALTVWDFFHRFRGA